jgi:hypothetical protein
VKLQAAFKHKLHPARARLDVALEDAALVRMMHGAHQGGDQSGDVALAGARVWRVEAPRAVLDLAGEAAPFKRLHAEEAPPFILCDLEDLHDVFVAESGRGLRLDAEPLEVRCRSQRAGADVVLRPEASGRPHGRARGNMATAACPLFATTRRVSRLQNILHPRSKRFGYSSTNNSSPAWRRRSPTP